jgi:hypothetical protein
MKNRILCFFCLTVVFLSCDKNDDLLVWEEESHVLIQHEDKSGIALTAVHPFRQDTCMDLTTINWLSGTAVSPPILEMAPQEGDLPSKRFVLEVSGDAMSEHLARGYTELKLTYRNNPHSITGELVTRFYFGEVLELKFEGVSEFQYEGQRLKVEVDVQEAILRTGTELYFLEEGVLRFSIPLQPEGPLSIAIETNIKICS